MAFDFPCSVQPRGMTTTGWSSRRRAPAAATLASPPKPPPCWPTGRVCTFSQTTAASCSLCPLCGGMCAMVCGCQSLCCDAVDREYRPTILAHDSRGADMGSMLRVCLLTDDCTPQKMFLQAAPIALRFQTLMKKVSSRLHAHRSAPGGDRVVQKYVSDPVTWRGRKFDIRLHVAVKSFTPLDAYLHTGWCAIAHSCSLPCRLLTYLQVRQPSA